MALALMIDLSSNNAVPNLQAHWDAGYRTIALKATEATSYVWTLGNSLADKWHQLGGKVVRYPFVRSGDPVAEANYYLTAIAGHVKAGDVHSIDAETAGVDGVFVARFIRQVTAKGPRFGLLHRPLPGLVYGPPYFLRAAGIRPVDGWGLWLADYSGKPSFIPPGWKTWTALQFTDHAAVPGEAGRVDQSHIRGFLLPALHRPVIAYPTLRVGSTGPWVSKLQDLLNKHGAHLTVDGAFGPATRNAVNAYKRSKGWRPDGAVRGRMWQALTK
jgi:GH25 family lysozyme M1 (1,4-beta-N-acetylmuramidase)